jgi:outer membrane protein assembly factor BamE
MRRYANPVSPMRLLVCFLLAIAAPGCGFAVPSIIHKIDIQQGNVIVPETVAKLKKGMSRNDVKQLMGTPLLTDVFHGNRWDYYFSNEKRGQLLERTTLSLYFEDEKLVAVTGDVAPGSAGTAPVVSPKDAPKSAVIPPAAAPAKSTEAPGTPPK